MNELTRQTALTRHDRMVAVLQSYGGEWERFDLDGKDAYMSDQGDVVEVVSYTTDSAELIARDIQCYLTDRMPLGVPCRVVFR